MKNKQAGIDSIINSQSSIVNNMEPEHLESLYPVDSRKKEIDQILSFIRDGKSCQLIAMPGVGRGNLLGFLAYNRNIRIAHVGEKEQLQYHFVLCNFSEVKNRPLIDIVKFLFLELTSSLHERRREEEFLVVDAMFKEALSYNDELVIFQGLKKAIDFLALEKNINIVFLLERFETYIPMVTSDFFNNLRSIRNRAKYKFSVVFSTTRPLEETLDSSILADFYEFIVDHHVYMSLMDAAGTTFRIEHLEKLTGKNIPEEGIKKILQLTAGHGKLTRLSLEYLSSWLVQDHSLPDFGVVPLGGTPHNDKDKPKENLEKLLLSQKTIQGALWEIWYFLTPDEQQDMLTLCKGDVCPLPSVFLQKVGLIEDNKITIPLFQSFIHDKITPQATSGHIVFDATNNTIKKGGLTLSDNLTVSEFRLLRVLIENPDKVLERDEIINAVWKEAKSQAGVSDQAVDQLIFRLRKKIEDDPNNPQHIQTIKGRGVKFTP